MNVTEHDTSIPIVVGAIKRNQFGSFMFSVRHQSAIQADGPNRSGTNNTYCRFLVILTIRRSDAVTKIMKMGIEPFSPLNASGIGLPGTLCLKICSISGRNVNMHNDASEASNASAWVNRKSTMCTMSLSI